MNPSSGFRVGGAILFASVFLIGTLLIGGSLAYAVLIAACGGLAWLAMGHFMGRRRLPTPNRGPRDTDDV